MNRGAMSSSICRTFVAATALQLLPLAILAAQRTVTVTGHVTSHGVPLIGAHVRIDEIRPPIDRVTTSDGRYSLLIPASSVQGQTVRIVATMADRRIRYLPASATIRLTGEA